MKLTPRSLAAAGAAAVLAVSLTACGGGDEEASVDTSVEASAEASGASLEEFCKVGQDSLAEMGANLDDPDAAEQAWQDAADAMEEVGTPVDMPDDARAGFEATIDALRDLTVADLNSAMEEAASADSPEEAERIANEAFGFAEGDVEKFEAFTQYVESNC